MLVILLSADLPSGDVNQVGNVSHFGLFVTQVASARWPENAMEIVSEKVYGRGDPGASSRY